MSFSYSRSNCSVCFSLSILGSLEADAKKEFDVLRGCPVKGVNAARQLSASEAYPEGLTAVGYPHFLVHLGRGIWVQHLCTSNLIKLLP